MSYNTNIPAFRPTAFDTVATNFWQDFVQGNPIGGGAAYESKLRELPLDESLESLKHLDRLLLAIKKDLQKRGYDEKMVLQQTSFRNLLLFIMFYTGRVLMHALQQTGSWQPLAHMEQYYPKVAFGNSDNKFYHLAAFFPQSFLADTRIPPMFVLLTLGAKLFGSFERKFSEPLMGEIAPESLYWGVAGYVQMVSSFPVVQQATMLAQTPASAPTPQGVPSKIAQTAPKPISQPQDTQGLGEITAIRPTPPTPQASAHSPAGIRPTGQQLQKVLQNAPVAPPAPTPLDNGLPKRTSQLQPQPHSKTQVHPALHEKLHAKQRTDTMGQPSVLPNSSQPSLQTTPNPSTNATPQTGERLILPNLDRNTEVNPFDAFDALSQTLLQNESGNANEVGLSAISQTMQATAQQSAPQTVSQTAPAVSSAPSVVEPTPHQVAQAKLEQESQKATPKPNLSLHFHSDAPKNPAPPPAPHHKEHRFQAGGLAPMSLAPPVVTVQSAKAVEPPQHNHEDIKNKVAKNLAQNTARQSAQSSQPSAQALVQNPVQNTNQGLTQSVAKTPTNTPLPNTASPSTTAKPSTSPKKVADDSLFGEIYQDLQNLPAANARADAEFQKAKAVLDNYDTMIATQVAKGQTMISFTDEEMTNTQRAVEFIKKMANGGNTNAMITYGLCCFKGVAMPQDMEQGAIWIHKAADANDIRAQKFLSRLYYQGVGVEQSIRQGEMWLEKAANGGHPEAQKIQTQFTHIKVMKDDYKVETQKDKRYALIFIALGIVVAGALLALKLFV